MRERTIEVSDDYEEKRKYYKANQEVQKPEFIPYFFCCDFLSLGLSHSSNVPEHPLNVNFGDRGKQRREKGTLNQLLYGTMSKE